MALAPVQQLQLQVLLARSASERQHLQRLPAHRSGLEAAHVPLVVQQSLQLSVLEAVSDPAR